MPKASLMAAVVLLPLIAFGQQQTAAAEAEQTLRARVTEFLQYHVDGSFRKAYEMVAEDTKDNYFASGKAPIKSFKIDDVKFTDNFTRATVTGTISKTLNMAGQDVAVTVPSTSTWKIENGKWVWYMDAPETWATPAGLSLPPTSAQTATPAPADEIAKNLDPRALAAAAQSILQAVSVDKKEITLDPSQVSEGRVIFHNGMTGSVQLLVNAPDVPGFSATIAQSNVRAGADMPVVFHYEPGGQTIARGPLTVQLTVQPLNQVFAVRVNFAAAVPAK